MPVLRGRGETMMDNNRTIYTRQESLGIITDQTVSVIGCGGIGSWVGYFLGLAGVERLNLFDGDKIETHNLNRLPFTPADLGKYKSEALAELIHRARPETKIDIFGHFDPEWHHDQIRASRRVVVSTDSLRSRKMVYDCVRSREGGGNFYGKYLELGADGHGMTVTGAPAEWSTEAENEPGYQSVPVFVGPCTMAASIGAYHILLGLPMKDTIRIDWNQTEGLKINQYQGV